jgi:hypothetical protein
VQAADERHQLWLERGSSGAPRLMMASAPAPLESFLARLEGLVPANAPEADRLAVFGATARVRRLLAEAERRAATEDATEQMVAVGVEVRGTILLTRTLLNRWRGTVLPANAPGVPFTATRSIAVARYDINGEQRSFFGISSDDPLPDAVPRASFVFTPQFSRVETGGRRCARPTPSTTS